MPSTPEFQQTDGKVVGFSGTALHTGEKVTLKLHPAPVDHGIKFKRKDLQDEPPIGDGSAQIYVDLIKKAGITTQEEPRKFFDARDTMHVESKTGALLVLLPDDKFRISCTQAGPNNQFTHFLSLEVGPEISKRGIA